MWDLLQLDAFRQPRLPPGRKWARQQDVLETLVVYRPTAAHRPAGVEREIDKLAPIVALELPTGFRIGVSSRRLTRHRFNARQY